MSHIDAFETTAVLALTKTEETEAEEETEEAQEEFLERAEDFETRTPLALPPSTTISSTLQFKTTLPPNFSIPRTRASTMALEPPTG